MSRYARLAFFLICCAFAALSGCTTKVEPKQGVYKVGKPYQVSGLWYYPRENSAYDETGIASWYGDAFHGGTTANGEAFDMDTMTAAHPTLPMPTLVRVTNLDNGRSVTLRVNDRGPFKAGRIIDVSRRAAELLEFKNNGTAKVRVQYLGRAPIDPKAPMDFATPRGQEIAKAAPTTDVSSSALAPPPGTSAAPATSMTRPTSTVAAPATQTTPSAAAPPPVVQIVPVPRSPQIYVQAGAFKSTTNARKLEARVGTLGKTSIAPAMIDGEQFHRVRLGPFPRVTEADSMLAKLLSMGIKGAKIVVD
jgi:rare lipoprotein A